MKKPTKSPQATPSKPSEITFGEMIRKAGNAAVKEVVKSNKPMKQAGHFAGMATLNTTFDS